MILFVYLLLVFLFLSSFFFFFFNDTATTEIYTLFLHDALPISGARKPRSSPPCSSPASPAGIPAKKFSRPRNRGPSSGPTGRAPDSACSRPLPWHGPPRRTRQGPPGIVWRATPPRFYGPARPADPRPSPCTAP